MNRRQFLVAGLSSLGLLIPKKSFSLENIFGNVSDILTENPVEGANIRISNCPSGEIIGEYITDNQGNYTANVTGVNDTMLWGEIKLLFHDENFMNSLARKPAAQQNSGIIKAEIIHPNFYNAIRYFDLTKYNGNKLNSKILTKNFDMENFDAWARASGKPLRRWDTNPTWYINPQHATQPQIDMVTEIINVDLVEFTDGFLDVSIKNTSEQKNEPGSIYVHWVEEGDYYANHEETLEDNKITWARTWFTKKNIQRRVYLRQLTQVLGFLNYPSNKEFYSTNGILTEQGLNFGKFLYNSKAGNISPDTEPALL
jgi:hypothetical protein